MAEAQRLRTALRRANRNRWDGADLGRTGADAALTDIRNAFGAVLAQVWAAIQRRSEAGSV